MYENGLYSKMKILEEIQIRSPTKSKRKKVERHIFKSLDQKIQKYSIDIHNSKQLNIKGLIQHTRVLNIQEFPQLSLQDTVSDLEKEVVSSSQLKKGSSTKNINFLNITSGFIFYKVKPILSYKEIPYKPMEAFEYAIIFGQASKMGHEKYIQLIIKDFKFFKNQTNQIAVTEDQINKIELKFINSVNKHKLGDQDQLLTNKGLKYIHREMSSIQMLIDDGLLFYKYMLFLKWQVQPDNYIIYLKNQPICEWLLEKLTPMVIKIRTEDLCFK